MSELLNINPDALIADGLEKAFIGYVERCNQLPTACYDKDKVIEIFINQGMSLEDAIEYFEYNINGAYVGEYTPFYLTKEKTIMSKKKRTAVIDADMVVWRSSFASEQEIKWDDDIWTLQSDMNEMKSIVDETIDYIQTTTEADDYVMVFSDKRNFRYDIFPEYKANRKGKRKPLGLKAVMEWCCSKRNGIRKNNLEADDVVGMMCCGRKDRVAVSGDKDFGTLNCEWFNFLKAETSHTTLEEANYNHLAQTLSGDSVDGFSGASGIGPKTAIKLLDKNGATWKTVVDAYESKGQNEEEALLNARLSYILRSPKEYNEKEGEVRLWKPKVQK